MAEHERLREVAGHLRALLESPPRSSEAVAGWTERAQATFDHIVQQFPDVTLPVQVMHYVHDADIRVRDEEYAAGQDRALRQIIADLERGVVPPSHGINFSVAIRDLVPIVLIIIIIVAAALWFWATR